LSAILQALINVTITRALRPRGTDGHGLWQDHRKN
jgi:hypothetical protein